jgi:5-formaminoimidazole-4-carboxamide-1-beta-D-ribofuranosyl 5'-monophosphate synthetase
MSKQYNLFISHSWSYSDAYEKLINLLNSDKSFSYKNYSVPKDDPIHNAKNTDELKEAIKQQMQYASVVLVLAGVYSTYSKWINIEIDLAKNGFSNKKPIIAIEPWGSERTSTVVKDNADKIVKWQTSSIISAIKELG